MKYISTAAALALLLSSCSFLDVKPVIIEDTPYSSKTEVLYGLAGCYGVINNEEFYGNYYSLMLSGCDDLCYFNRTSTSNFSMWYRHDASSAEIYAAWTEIYSGIKNANAVMTKVENSEYDPDHICYNEARFLRAYYHFILAQTWGNVPLKLKEDRSAENLSVAATPQYDVLKWCISEMDECLALASESLENTPSRVSRTTMQGILARVCLFTAGATVDRNDGVSEKDYYKKAMDYAKAVIDSGKHRLNPSYSQVFINMISDLYDTDYRESMWEADFVGNQSSADNWSNGRIGDEIGLLNTASTDFMLFKSNYSYGRYNGSLKLWDMYLNQDRTTGEKGDLKDARAEWNLPPFNYKGGGKYPPYGQTEGTCKAGIDRTPYSGKAEDNKTYSTTENPTVAGAVRNCGKYRREVQYEGHQDSKRLRTQINYPILRYSDVLLMYAEAYNEYYQAPSQEAYDYVAEVRTRAGVSTNPFSDYSDYASFRDFVRNERGRELCFESLRKYDLIRWGIFVEQMHKYADWTSDARWSDVTTANLAASTGTTVQDKHIVMPIPSIELGVNTLLRQHPLW